MRKLCFIIATLCLLPLHAAEFVPIESGKAYSVPIGWRDLMGRGQLMYKDGVYYVHATIKIFGAGSFSYTTPEEVLEYSRLCELPPKAYFKTGATSFHNIPAISEKIAHITRTIESTLERNDFKLSIEVIFGDDSEVMNMAELKEDFNETNDDYSRYNLYMGNLFSGINEKYRDCSTNNLATPIIIAAKSDPNVVTPNLWDIYSNPLLLAHEFVHLLGSHFEGYEYVDYPAQGIMNAEDTINALKQNMPNEKMKLLDADRNEVLASLLSGARPRVNESVIELAFPEASHSSELYLESYPDGGYWCLSRDQRLAAAAKKVQALRDLRPTDLVLDSASSGICLCRSHIE